MAEMKHMGVLLTAFFLLIMGIIFLQVISDRTNSVKTLNTVTGDTFASPATWATCTQVTDGCIDSIIVLYNNSETQKASNYSLCRSSTGRQDGIRMNETFSGYTITTNYTYSADCTYVADSVSRTVINLIPIFFALAIIAIAIVAFIKNKEDWS